MDSHRQEWKFMSVWGRNLPAGLKRLVLFTAQASEGTWTLIVRRYDNVFIAKDAPHSQSIVPSQISDGKLA